MSVKKRFYSLKRSAKKRNISVDLNLDRYTFLLKHGCSYCGKELMSETGYSIDRIDPKRGYVYNNSWGCCWNCNRSKGTLTHVEFLTWMRGLFDHQKKLQAVSELAKSYKRSDIVKANNILKNKASYKNSERILLEGDR